MKQVTLGSTGIKVKQNGFGALPIQRIEKEKAVALLRRAYENGIEFFDTARAYTDSEEKVGEALSIYPRESYYLATKTQSRVPEEIVSDLNTSLSLLKTSYVDIYQLHEVDMVYKPNDGSGVYETLQQLKAEGKIRHIGITTHKIAVAREIIESGLYETLQYPFSYLSGKEEQQLIQMCIDHNMGFIGMKGLAGGLITNARAAMANVSRFDNIVPIWGIQRESELDQWLSFNNEEVEYTDEIAAFIEKDRKELAGDFCRGCGYCMATCPAHIEISTCARMSLLLRRSPSARFFLPEAVAMMNNIENCIHCNVCTTKCPYQLDTPNLLIKNLADYRNVISGKIKVQ